MEIKGKVELPGFFETCVSLNSDTKPDMFYYRVKYMSPGLSQI